MSDRFKKRFPDWRLPPTDPNRAPDDAEPAMPEIFPPGHADHVQDPRPLPRPFADDPDDDADPPPA